MPSCVTIEHDYWALFESSQMGLSSIAGSFKAMGFGEVLKILRVVWL